MIGAIAGAALSAIGSIYGGIKSAQAARKVRKGIRKQMNENQDWYDRNYNEDYTQRADAQRILTMTQDAIRKRNKAVAGTQAVMGGTEESVAAAKAANNQALADTASRIAAAGEARKDQVENQYLNRKEALQNQLNQSHAQQAQNIAAATQGVANAAGSIGLALDANAKPKSLADTLVKEGKNGQLDTSKLVEVQKKMVDSDMFSRPTGTQADLDAWYNSVAERDRNAAAWLDELAERESIWDAQ